MARDAPSGNTILVAESFDLVPSDVATHEFRVEIRRVRVTHRVLDSQDEPVPDVDVLQRFGPLRTEARTDAEGRFTLEAMFVDDSALFAELRCAEYDGTAFLSEDEDDVHPPLPAPRVVTGRLVRTDGSPVAGRRVAIVAGFAGMHGDYYPRWSSLRESVSGADGAFTMPLLSGPNHFVRSPVVGELNAHSEEDGPTTYKLPDVVRIAGTVVAAESGQPLAGALVCFSDDVLARTGADGTFAFSWIPPRDRPLRIVRDGCLPAPLDGPRVELRRAHVVAGHVRHLDGSAARGLQLVARSRDDTREGTPWTCTSATDADGRFVVPGLAAGPCVVTVTDPTHFAIANVSVVTTAGDESVALVVRPGARLAVEVVDGAGKVVGGARVVAHPADAEFADVEATARYDGRVEIGLATGTTYSLRVELDGFEPVERADVRGGGEPLRIVLARKPPR